MIFRMKMSVFKKNVPFGFLLKYSASVFLVSGITILCMFHSSCQITPEGIKMVSEDYECPVVKSYKVKDASSLEVDFSKPVTVKKAILSPLEENQNAVLGFSENEDFFNCNCSASGTRIDFNFEGFTETGKRYQLYSEIKDDVGNTLSLAIPFYGYNEKVPVILLSKVAPNTSSSKYVELTALTPGNLYGLELHLSYNKILYQFPDVTVKAGERITVHFKYEGDGFDELSENVSGGKTSGRDLFFNDITKKSTVSGSGDVVFVINRNTDTILDGFMYCKANDKTGEYKWSRDFVKQNALKLSNAGVWNGDGSEICAFNFSGTKKVFSRKAEAVEKVKEQLSSDLWDGIYVASKDDWNF